MMVMKSILLCGFFVTFILGCAGYILFQAVIEFLRENTEFSGATSRPVTKLSHLQCGKIECSGIQVII